MEDTTSLKYEYLDIAEYHKQIARQSGLTDRHDFFIGVSLVLYGIIIIVTCYATKVYFPVRRTNENERFIVFIHEERKGKSRKNKSLVKFPNPTVKQDSETMRKFILGRTVSLSANISTGPESSDQEMPFKTVTHNDLKPMKISDGSDDTTNINSCNTKRLKVISGTTPPVKSTQTSHAFMKMSDEGENSKNSLHKTKINEKVLTMFEKEAFEKAKSIKTDKPL